MCRIYDTFEITRATLDLYPDLMADLEEGLMVVLDYQEPLDASDLIGRTVEIIKPDREIVRHRIAHA